MTGSIRSALLGRTKVVELETKGLIRASWLSPGIEKAVIPRLRDGEEVVELVPVVVALDARNAPTEFPGQVASLANGLAACTQRQLIVAWFRGTFKVKVESVSVELESLLDASVQQYRMEQGEARFGVDLRTTYSWSILTPEGLPENLAQDYASSLCDRLGPRQA